MEMNPDRVLLNSEPELFLCRYYLLARREKGWGIEGIQETFSLLLPNEYQVIRKLCLVLLFPKFHIILLKWQVVSETVGDYLDKAREEELVEEKVLLKRSQVGHICVCSESAMCAGA